ncbi:u4 u6 small nuclear ribonucleoprotein, partial [Nannochloropsis oceanica]
PSLPPSPPLARGSPFPGPAVELPKIRYKIDVNAQQSGLSGAVLSCRDPSFGEEGLHLVVVEGGPRSIRRFVKLMTRRIKWNAQDASKGGGMEGGEEGEESEEEEEEEGGAQGGGEGEGKCELVWRGVVAKPAFTGFKFQECRTLTTARKVFEVKGVVHYVDMTFQGGGGGEGEDRMTGTRTGKGQSLPTVHIQICCCITPAYRAIRIYLPSILLGCPVGQRLRTAHIQIVGSLERRPLRQTPPQRSDPSLGEERNDGHHIMLGIK